MLEFMYEAIADMIYALGVSGATLGVASNIASLSVGVYDSSSKTFRQWYEKFTPEHLPDVTKPVMRTFGIISYPGYSIGRKLLERSTS